jgi:hypothetical protein
MRMRVANDKSAGQESATCNKKSMMHVRPADGYEQHRTISNISSVSFWRGVI